MKYRKQMLAMRKRNMELLEKLKEVGFFSCLPPSFPPSTNLNAASLHPPNVSLSLSLFAGLCPPGVGDGGGEPGGD